MVLSGRAPSYDEWVGGWGGGVGDKPKPLKAASPSLLADVSLVSESFPSVMLITLNDNITLEK